MAQVKKVKWRLDEKAFWPSLRADTRNTGRAPKWADNRYRKDINWPDKPWAFKMGKASTCAPVIGADGTIYLGSADHNFYAIKYDGSLKWKIKIKMVIDDAAVIARRTDMETGEEQDYVFFPGADGFARKVNCNTGEVEGIFEATDHYIGQKARGVPKCNWFESDFTFSESGRLLAGCDDFAFYQIDPETMTSACPEYLTGNQVWCGSPTGLLNEHYICGLDSFFRSITESGKLRWIYPIFGMAGAAPTILDNGDVVIGSGNNSVYCFKNKGFLKIGRIRWKFHTKGDIWSAAALSHDGSTLYISSADGIIYAINSYTGKLRWSFPTLGPNRCGCVLDKDGNVFIASGDGKIYKLSGENGHRIWSFDCHQFNTLEKLNEWDRCHFVSSSIALSPGGVYAPNQNGNLYYIPFKYMESDEARADPRCNFDPNPDIPLNGKYILRISPGGHPIPGEINEYSDSNPKIVAIKPLGRSDTLFFKFVQVENGQIKDTRIIDTNITSDPPFKMHVQISTDARYINIVPEEFLKPDTKYNINIKIKYIIPKKYGWLFLSFDRIWKGKQCEGFFEVDFFFKTIKSILIIKNDLPLLQIGDINKNITGDILVLKNIFPWQEALMINLAIIALDDVYILACPVYYDVKNKRIILWCEFGEKITGIENDSHPELASYRVIPQPESTPFRFPLDFTFDIDGTFSLTTSGFKLNWAGVGMPFKFLKMSGRLNEKLELFPGSTAYFETPIKEIPLFGPLLKAMNVVNKDKNFMTAGTFRLEKAKGPVLKTSNISIESVNISNDEIIINVKNDQKSRIELNDHFISVLLINLETGLSIKQDYQNNISFISDSTGALKTIKQKIDKKLIKDLIGNKKCLMIIIVDTTPAYKQII
ncbi:MAG: outer membrane protein assembly factor BamB family protein [Candidatus Helarchaeota archaeon]